MVERKVVDNSDFTDPLQQLRIAADYAAMKLTVELNNKASKGVLFGWFDELRHAIIGLYNQTAFRKEFNPTIKDNIERWMHIKTAQPINVPKELYIKTLELYKQIKTHLIFLGLLE